MYMYNEKGRENVALWYNTLGTHFAKFASKAVSLIGKGMYCL
jgi:hypothetical protein